MGRIEDLTFENAQRLAAINDIRGRLGRLKERIVNGRLTLERLEASAKDMESVLGAAIQRYRDVAGEVQNERDAITLRQQQEEAARRAAQGPPPLPTRRMY